MRSEDDLEGVEGHAAVAAGGADDHGLELPVEVVGDGRVVALEEAHPALLGHLLLVLAERALHLLDVGLVEHAVRVLVHDVQQLAQELLRVVLREALEGRHVLPHALLELVRPQLALLRLSVAVEQRVELLQQPPLRPQRVVLVDEPQHVRLQEHLLQHLAVEEALQRRVHVATCSRCSRARSPRRSARCPSAPAG